MQDEATYSFGPFALDAGRRVLLQDGAPLRLTPKEVDVLAALVVRHGEIVDKGQLLEQVWRGVCVEECNLSQHVAALRRVLGDDAHHPIYIETVPRRGYRFVAPVARAIGPSAQAGTPVPYPGASTPVPTPPPMAGPRSPLARHAPVALLVLATLGLGLWWRFIRADGRSPATAVRSIAVLPVANLTGDAHQDDLAETLTSQLMTDLGGVRGLRVEAAHPPAEGHPAAGVDALVEVALLSGEGRVEIAAELIDARTSHLIWAEVFESEPVSWLDAEKRVVQVIVSRLGSVLGRSDRASSARAAAQREHALARKYLSRRTPQVVQEALEHFTAAAELDPGYAAALAGVASAYLLGAEQRVLEPSEALSRAETAARRALELAPSAEAHGALGEIAAARWDFESAEASYRRALALDPSIASVHERYAALLTVQDRHEEAIAQARVARDLDPACPAAATALAAAYYHSGRSDEAIDKAHAALRLTPGFAAAYDVLGWAHQAQGRDAEAVGAFGEAVRLSDRSPTYLAALARAHARAGARDEARRLLAELERGRRNRPTSPLDLAEVLAALGEADRALRQVERAGAEGAPWLQHVDAGLSLTMLHDHARFRDLVRRMRRATSSAGGSGMNPEAAAPGPAAPEPRGAGGSPSPGSSTPAAGGHR